MVCLCLEHLSKILQTGSIKPISAILSASSITTVSTSSNFNARLSKRSSNLPGQATSISTPLFSALYWFLYDTPPYIETTSLSTAAAIGLRTELICSASSLVGVNIKLVGLFEWALLDLVINGRPNAKVLPEPVGALQHTSLPSNESGIVSV